jgi:hypothetical protein
MSRILLRLSLLIPLLLVLTMVIEAYGRVLPPTPDALLDICPVPCVLGITPSLTHAREVEDILVFTLPPTNSVINTSDVLGRVNYTFETNIGGQYVFGVVSTNLTDDFVQSVSFTSQFPLTTLFEKWGAPDCIQLTSDDNNALAAGVLQWQRATYAAQALFVFSPTTLDWTTATVQVVTITTALAGCGADMKTWQGFAPVWRYQ